MNHVQIVLFCCERLILYLLHQKGALSSVVVGAYPLQESPWSATSFSYQCSLRVFPRVQSRMHIQYGNTPWGCNVLYTAQAPSRLTVSTYFLASDFRRTRIPTTGLCEEVNGLEISIALERSKLQQLSGIFFFFFFTVYLQICLSASLDDFLENSGKALIISKRLKLPECPNR